MSAVPGLFASYFPARLQLAGFDVGRVRLAKIEAQIKKVSDAELAGMHRGALKVSATHWKQRGTKLVSITEKRIVIAQLKILRQQIGVPKT